jgi:DNA topoisomerase-1
VVAVKVGPYGPYVELAAADGDGKPKRVSLPEDVKPEDVDLQAALLYLSLPRPLGSDPATGDEVSVGLGRYGPYVRKGKTYANLPSAEHMFTVTLREALELVREKESSGGRRVLRSLGAHPESGVGIELLDGRYGPYVTDGSTNATIPKSMEPDEVDLDTAVDLLRRKAARGGGARGRGAGKGGGAKGGSTRKGGSAGKGGSARKSGSAGKSGSARKSGSTRKGGSAGKGGAGRSGGAGSGGGGRGGGSR